MPRLTAADLRNRYEWDVELEPDWTVRVRRVDMVSAFLSGDVPLPLMAALDRLKKRSAQLQADPSAVMAVPQQDKEQTLELLRRYACAAIIDPVFVMEPDGDPNHASIKMLTSDQLLKVWQSGPRKDRLPEVSAQTADAFRIRLEQEQSAAAVSDEPEVPPAPELVSAGSALADSGYA